MGVSWVVQMRPLHLVIIIVGATIMSLVMYVVYMPTHQSRTASPVLLPVSLEFHAPQTNTTTPKLSFMKNDTAANLRNISSGTPPIPPVNNRSLPDFTQAFPVELIYEAGHMNTNLNICLEEGKRLQLLIMITSAPSHESARMAIRQTWGHFAARRDVAIVFMLGTTTNTTYRDAIDKEQFMYEDILQGKYVDSYENLTLKVVSMLEWVKDYCPKADFVLKSDDDMFINIPRLLTFITKHSSEVRAIYGRLVTNWEPHRDKQSKYYISPQQFRPEVYPDFTTGPAYLLPGRLADELYTTSLTHTYIAKLEDVFLTGVVANDLKIKRILVPEFLNVRVSDWCSIQRAISIHEVKGSEQFDLWKKLLDGNAKCK